MTFELNRKSDENEHQYIWRLCSAKDSGVLDMTWDKLADVMNRNLRADTEHLSESAYRKKYQQAKAFYEEVFSKMVSDEYSQNLDIQKRELEKERQKLYATKVEYSRNIRHQGRFELMFENIANVAKLLDPPEFERYDLPENPKCYALGIADIHYGADFISENNVYSREICKERFSMLLSALEIYIKENQVDKLKIINAADSIQGILRISDLQVNDTDVVNCVVEISQIISSFLNELSASCEIEYYHITQANHSQTRNLGTKASELVGEDLEKIIANYIHDVLANNPRVSVIFNDKKEYVDFNIFDFNCTAEHGHRIGNINTYLKDKGNLRRKLYSYGFLGHSHSSQEVIVGEEEFNNTTVFVIPSFIGSDPYSDKLNLGAKAMAKMFVFDKVYGHVESRNIILN